MKPAAVALVLFLSLVLVIADHTSDHTCEWDYAVKVALICLGELYGEDYDIELILISDPSESLRMTTENTLAALYVPVGSSDCPTWDHYKDVCCSTGCDKEDLVEVCRTCLE